MQAGVDEELASFVDHGVTVEELADAKKALAEERKVGRAQDGNLASAMVSQLNLGRTMAFSDRQDAQIANLGVDQVNAVVRKYIKPDHFVHYFAGDFAGADKVQAQKAALPNQ